MAFVHHRWTGTGVLFLCCLLLQVLVVVPDQSSLRGVSVVDAAVSTPAPGGSTTTTSSPGAGQQQTGGGADSSTDVNTFIDVDIIFESFSEARLSTYLTALAASVGVPVARILPQRLDNTLAMEFGSQYIFPLRVNPPSNISGDVLVETEVARALEEAVNSATKTNHSALYKATMQSARRVREEYRVRVKATRSINYTWVAFLILALIMLVASAGVLLRPRGSDEAGMEDDEEEEEGHTDEKDIPDSYEKEEAKEKLDTALLQAQQEYSDEASRVRRKRDLEAQKTLKMLDITLEYDRAFSLPTLVQPARAPTEDDTEMQLLSPLTPNPKKKRKDEESGSPGLPLPTSPDDEKGEGSPAAENEMEEGDGEEKKTSGASSPPGSPATGGGGGAQADGGGGGGGSPPKKPNGNHPEDDDLL